jgi:hypothetical protein
MIMEAETQPPYLIDPNGRQDCDCLHNLVDFVVLDCYIMANYNNYILEC